MRVAADGQHIVASFKFVAAELVGVGVVPVKRCHILCHELQRHHFALAGLKLLRLAERGQIDIRLFNSALGVRRGVVQLHNVLACHIARVRHTNLHRDGFIRRMNHPSRRNVPLDFLRKGGVAQAVAERVHDILVIPCFAGIMSLRLIITVADINAFAVFHGVIICHRIVDIDVVVHALAVFKVLLIRAEIRERRIFGEIDRVSICSAAGRRNLAREDVADCRRAVVAGMTHPENRINAEVVLRLRRIHFRQLHRIGGVDNQDDFGKIRLHVTNQVFFRVRQLQHVRIRVSILVLRIAVSHFIPALRARTGNNHQRCIAVSIVSVGDGIRNIRRLHFCRLCAVKGQQTFVDIKARLLHAIFQRGFRHTVLPRTARARATAAHHDVGSTETEHGHLRRRTIQRQHTVILEQHKAFFTQLNIQRLCRRAFLRQIREVSVVLSLRKHKTRLRARHRHQRFFHRAFRKRRRNRRTQQRRAAENRQPLGNRSLHVSFLLLLIDCLSAIIGWLYLSIFLPFCAVFRVSLHFLPINLTFEQVVVIIIMHCTVFS